MSDSAPSVSPRTKLRKWHSLTGVLPLGAFVIEHLLTNASALGGQAHFDRVVGSIARSSITPVVEIVFVILPLAFHALYGLHLTAKKGDDASSYPFDGKKLLALERISGIVALVFILTHVWEFRLQHAFFGLGAGSFYTRLAAHLSMTTWGIPFIALGYLVGIAAVTFHFANGMVSFATTWGYATTVAAQKRAVILFGALGTVLFFIGALTVIGTATGTRLLPGAEEGKTRPCGSTSPPPSATP